MIGRLRGTLVMKRPPWLILDVGGVGYELEAPMSTFFQLPVLEKVVVLHTHLVVREDAQLLYGFATEDERELFRQLIKVNGVGPKLALTILSGISADDFARCVNEGETAALVRLPGVGKKTAERLVIEMRGRFDDWRPNNDLSMAAGAESVAVDDPVKEALTALIALGYKPQEASRMLQGLDTKEKRSEDIIRMALQGAVR